MKLRAAAKADNATALPKPLSLPNSNHQLMYREYKQINCFENWKVNKKQIVLSYLL
jgi:hypothetical protein